MTRFLLLMMIVTCSISHAQVSITNVSMTNVRMSQTVLSAWTFDAETQTITGYDGSLGTDIEIPATIGGIDVLHIGANAMDGDTISSVVFPEGLLTIGASAFNGGTITAATAPSTLTTIGAAAFAGNDIREWWLPDHVTISATASTLGSYQGSALYSLYYQEGQIGGYFSDYQAVGGYPWIRHDISPTHLAAYTITGDTITDYNPAIGGTIAVLPFKKDDVTIVHIDDYAFNGKGLTGLRFPTQTYGGQFPGGGQYTAIDFGAFMTNNISIIQIPGSLSTIGVNAFNGCGATMIQCHASGNPTYGSAVFNNCYGLTSANYVMGVVNIPTLMFGNSSSLSSILLHYGAVETYDPLGLDNYSYVVSIGDSAFVGSNISEITIPSTCTSVGNGAFQTIPGISRITIPAGVAVAHANSFNNNLQNQASFKDFYETGGSLAGTYVYSGGAWSKTH